jgi:nitrate reductase gamma subunit
MGDLPAPGRGMTLLLGLIVIVGFILEGLRIAMTGWPEGANYAVIGYSISLMLKGMTGITNIYGPVWYIHAILTGAFVAMIPFTRMIHMLTAPVVLIAGARSRIQSNQ